MAGPRESGAVLLFPSPYHCVLAVKGYAPIALGPVGRLRTLTAVLRRADDGSGQFRTLQPEIAMSTHITDEQRFLLLANGSESLQNQDFDPVPVVKD